MSFYFIICGAGETVTWTERQKTSKIQDLSRIFEVFYKELLTGIGPVTSALPMRRSTD